MGKYFWFSTFLTYFAVITTIPFLFFGALFDVLIDEKDTTSTIFSFIFLLQFGLVLFVVSMSTFPASLFLIYNLFFCINHWKSGNTTKKMKSTINEITEKLEKKVDEFEIQSTSENYEQIEHLTISTDNQEEEEMEENQKELNWENSGKYRFRGCYSIILFLCTVIFCTLPITIITIHRYVLQKY